MNIVDDLIKRQLHKDFYELIELVSKQVEETRFDRDAILRDQDDGACQIWYQRIPVGTTKNVLHIYEEEV